MFILFVLHEHCFLKRCCLQKVSILFSTLWLTPFWPPWKSSSKFQNVFKNVCDIRLLEWIRILSVQHNKKSKYSMTYTTEPNRWCELSIIDRISEILKGDDRKERKEEGKKATWAYLIKSEMNEWIKSDWLTHSSLYLLYHSSPNSSHRPIHSLLFSRWMSRV